MKEYIKKYNIISAAPGMGKTILANTSKLFVDIETTNYKYVVSKEQKKLAHEKIKGLKEI